MNITDLKTKLLKGGIWSFTLNILNQALLLCITILLTRLLGVDGFGVYSVVLSLMVLCALPFGGGLGIFVIRHVSKYLAQSRFDLLRGFITTSAIWIVLGSITYTAVLYHFLPSFISSNIHFYLTGLALVILIPTLLFCGALMRGMKYVIWGRIPEFFIQPLTLMLLLAGLFIIGVQNLSTNIALSLNIGSYVLAISASLIFLYFLAPKKITQKTNASYDFKSWIKSALPLLLSVGIIVINSNIDIIMVGHLASEAEAGGYRVASRMAGFILFFLFAANNVLGPVISSKHTKGEKEKLQKVLSSSTKLIFLCALAPTLLFWIWPHEILEILFGEEFKIAATALIVLAGANIFSVAMGQVGHVMALTGYEKYTAYAALIALVINILLNLWLIPQFGMDGAALATGFSIIAWNAILGVWTAQKTGYRCSIFSSLRKSG